MPATLQSTLRRGNYSGILRKLDRLFEALEIRLALPLFQLMIRCSMRTQTEKVEYFYRALSDAAKEAYAPLYWPGFDPFLENLAKNANRVFYFDEEPRA